MKIYDETKTILLDNPDLGKGYLVEDKIVKEIMPAQPEIKEQGHYETIREYSNGGKDVKWVIDVVGQEAREETPVYENIQVYIPYTEEEMLDHLRLRREEECFSIVNRGKLWYDNLVESQLYELQIWYEDWLDVTETKIVPQKPEWLK